MKTAGCTSSAAPASSEWRIQKIPIGLYNSAVRSRSITSIRAELFLVSPNLKGVGSTRREQVCID
jgi:hypothetical protein